MKFGSEECAQMIFKGEILVKITMIKLDKETMTGKKVHGEVHTNR